MTITLTIHGDSAPDFTCKLERVLELFRPQIMPAVSEVASDVIRQEDAPVAEEATTTRRPRRTKKPETIEGTVVEVKINAVEVKPDPVVEVVVETASVEPPAQIFTWPKAAHFYERAAESASAAPAEKIPFDRIRQAALEYTTDAGAHSKTSDGRRVAWKAICDHFGVEKLTELKESDYSAAIELIDERHAALKQEMELA